MFDTLLTRAVGKPSSRFLLLGRRLAARELIRCSAAAFARARALARERASANLGREPTLDEVYREVKFILGLNATEAATLRAKELAMESDLIRPIPGAVERLDQQRRPGKKVVFLLEPHLDPTWIRELLERHQLFRPGDDCREIGATGASDPESAAIHQASAVDIDAAGATVQSGTGRAVGVGSASASAPGLKSPGSARLNRYEQILESHHVSTEGLASVMAGASRLARLSVGADSLRTATIRDVAAGVAGPILTSYVLWVLLEARKQNLSRLYFLARDAHILMRIAQQLIPRLGLEIEVRYLYGGRRAWYIPSISGVEPADLFWAVDERAEVNSVETFLARIGIAPAEVESALEEMGFARESWKLHRPAPARDSLWQIARHPDVRSRILTHASDRRAEALAYFEQEGLLKDALWGVVDVGWSGRMLGAMNRILADRGSQVPRAFFFSRTVDAEKHALRAPSEIDAYFADHVLRLGYPGLVTHTFLELFTGADHGPTVGYGSEAGTMVPRLSSDGSDALVDWGLPVLHEGLLAFVDNLWLDDSSIDLSGNMRPVVAELFRTFFDSPSPEEARAWGAYPFAYGKSGLQFAPIAAPLRLRHLPRAWWNGWAKTRPGTEWIEAGLHLTPAPVRFALRCGFAVRNRFVKLRKVTGRRK